jgi:hypothetical protein
MTGEVLTETEWMSGRRARTRLNVTVAALYKLAARGLIHIKALPGEAVKYSARDVERLATAQESGE